MGDDDPLGSFVFRTTGYNSIRTLSARLQYFQAISGNRLSCLALELRLRGKSTRQSLGTPIYYVDITPRSGLSTEEMLAQARQLDDARRQAGFDQDALDQTARLGFGNGAFEDREDDGEVMEEFFPADSVTEGSQTPADGAANLDSNTRPSLLEKLEKVGGPRSQA